MQLQGKRALITGGALGFGAGIVQKFVAEGAKVVIFDLQREGADELISELPRGGQPSSIMVFEGDVRQREDVERGAAFALEEMGGLDIPRQ